jgi:hypothetical protein
MNVSRLAQHCFFAFFFSLIIKNVFFFFLETCDYISVHNKSSVGQNVPTFQDIHLQQISYERYDLLTLTTYMFNKCSTLYIFSNRQLMYFILYHNKKKKEKQTKQSTSEVISK